MPTIILNHRVKDYATWKTGFDFDEERRASSGARLLAVGQKAGDPGNVYAVFDVDNVAEIGKMMADPELQTRMQEFGVIGAPDVVVVE